IWNTRCFTSPITRDRCTRRGTSWGRRRRTIDAPRGGVIVCIDRRPVAGCPWTLRVDDLQTLAVEQSAMRVWGPYALALGLFFFTNGCTPGTLGERHFIDAGYVGWVHIRFGVTGAPALPVEDGFYVIRVPKNGLLQTSTKQEFGAAQEEYYY